MPKENDHNREFFRRLNIREKWNKTGTEAEVTYSYGDNEFTVHGLHYHPETLWHTALGQAVHRSHVLDYDKHDWPAGRNNTKEIIRDLVEQCRGDKKACCAFLEKLRDHVHATLVRGEPGRLRFYWPNILNNNHWHDVANFIKLCVEHRNDTARLVDQCQEGKNVYPLDRLVFRWLRVAKRNKGIYRGIYRYAFLGKYRMIETLLASVSSAKTQALMKYGSGGEGKDHRKLKEHLAMHPEKLGLKDTTHHEMEWRFISGDSADLVFWNKHGEITVFEIETDIPDPGAYQLIKYLALLCAENLLKLNSHKTHAILVAWSVPMEVREFCDKYGICWQEHSMPK